MASTCMYCGINPCLSIEMIPIIIQIQKEAREDPEKKNSEHRKQIYKEAARLIDPIKFQKGYQISIPDCIIQKLRRDFPDEKYSSFVAYDQRKGSYRRR